MALVPDSPPRQIPLATALGLCAPSVTRGHVVAGGQDHSQSLLEAPKSHLGATSPPRHKSSTQNDSQAASNSGMSLSDRISPKNPVVAPRSSKRNQNRNDKKKPEADVMDTELDQYKDETTRLREKYLAENPLPSNLTEHCMDVDDTHTPGWGDSHGVDDGMAP